MQKAYDEKRIVSGKYWCESDQKGCLVGSLALTEDSPHAKFSEEMNVPIWFPYLLDDVFEGLPDGKRQRFAVEVVNAIPIGFSNWQSFYHKLCLFNLEKICKNIDHPIVKQEIADIIILHRNEEKDEVKWSAARSAAESAWSAAESAWSVAGSAARSVAGSAAAYQKIADEIIRLLREKDSS